MIGNECIISIHFFLFVIFPLCRILNKNQMKFKLKLMGVVACILMLGNIIIGETTFYIYFASIFVLGFPLCLFGGFKKRKPVVNETQENKTPNTVIKETREYNVPTNVIQESDDYLKQLIMFEMGRCYFEKNDSIPVVEKRRKIAYFLLCILVFFAMCFHFFHIGFVKNGLFIIIGLILFMLIKRVNINKYILKQIKARPDEKISNILTNILQQKTHKKVLLPFILIPIIIPCVMFFEPHVFYESVEDGYRIRFYTIGVINKDKIEIPDEYNGKPVTSIRGNVFANIISVKEIELPNTITSINGRAFENTWFLERVKLPNNLEYLGGGAFRNSGIEEISLPDTLKEMGGEVFKDCHNLKKVKLSKNLKEIRGNSFENATSLKEIYIPDGIEVIKAHAFYGCKSLTKVRLPNSLKTIGSSAFRKCRNLSCINVVDTCYINERAFKESPTWIKRYDKDYQFTVDDYYKDGKCFNMLEVS